MLLVGPALAGKTPAQAPTFLLIAPPPCGSELARECPIKNARYPMDVPALREQAHSHKSLALDPHLICLRSAFDLRLICFLLFIRKMFKHRQSRLGCRPNADDAACAEPHGCGESAVRTWMSVRRGPTERRRSEGIPTQEEPSQEQAPLVTWGAFPSNSPKAKPRPLGRRC